MGALVRSCVGLIARIGGRTPYGRVIRFGNIEGPGGAVFLGKLGTVGQPQTQRPTSIGVRLREAIKLDDEQILEVRIAPRHGGYGLDALALTSIVVIVYLTDGETRRAVRTFGIGSVKLVSQKN